MVLTNLVAFIYNLMGVRSNASGSARIIKESTASSSYVVMKAVGMGISISNKVKEGCSPGEGSEGEICSVCLSSMKEGDDDMRVLPCLHQFHRVCVDRWLNKCRKNCPICRFSMGESEEDTFHATEAFTDDMLIWFSSFHVAGF